MSDNTMNNLDLQQELEAAREDLNNMKAIFDNAKKVNDEAYISATEAERAYQEEINKLNTLKLRESQARYEGNLDLARELNIEIVKETEIYKALLEVSQARHHEAQVAVQNLASAEEIYEVSQKNFQTMQDIQNTGTFNADTNDSTDINIGDKIQIKVGSIDVTNGVIAKSGDLYTEGSLLRATVESIDYRWLTGGRWNLPSSVTKIRCLGADGKTIVWQVTPDSITSNIIRSNVPTQTTPTAPKPVLTQTDEGKADLNVKDDTSTSSTIGATRASYTTSTSAQSWSEGITTKATTSGNAVTTGQLKTQLGSGSSMSKAALLRY